MVHRLPAKVTSLAHALLRQTGRNIFLEYRSREVLLQRNVERCLRSPGGPPGQKVVEVFTKQHFVDKLTQLQMRRRPQEKLDETVIEKRNSPLDGMSHIHLI